MTKNIWNGGETFSWAPFPGLVISSYRCPWLCATGRLMDSCGAGCLGWLDPWVPLHHPWSCDRQEWEMGPQNSESSGHMGITGSRDAGGENTESYHLWACIVDLQVVSLWWMGSLSSCRKSFIPDPENWEATESKNNSFQFLLENSYSELAEATGSTH